MSGNPTASINTHCNTHPWSDQHTNNKIDTQTPKFKKVKRKKKGGKKKKKKNALVVTDRAQGRRWYPRKRNKPRITTITRKEERWRSGSVDCGLDGVRIRLGSEGKGGEGRGGELLAGLELPTTTIYIHIITTTNANPILSIPSYVSHLTLQSNDNAFGNGFCSGIFFKYAALIN